jgi:hypothetical protein
MPKILRAYRVEQETDVKLKYLARTLDMSEAGVIDAVIHDRLPYMIAEKKVLELEPVGTITRERRHGPYLKASGKLL